VYTISPDQPQFWFLSVVIVGANIIIVLLLLLGVRRALLALGNTKVDNVRIVSTLGFVLFGWLALALFLAGQGVFRSALNQPVPYIALAIGIPILVVALATGFLSAPSRFQMFSLDAPDFLIGSFPLVMIPIFAVPLSIVRHLASLTKMSLTVRSATKQMASA
jgi:hypothetical protein